MVDFLFLADFSPIKPDPGLVLWTSVIFLLVWFVLGRFAFRPIQNALKQREKDIQSSLDEAKKAREEMANLKAENEELLAQAREERAKILKEAKAAKENIISEAKTQAKEEAQKIVANAKQQIEHQKMAALVEVKNTIGAMAVDIAEKVLRKDLENDKGQQDFVKRLVDEIEVN
jgi:F-type H+-transporting ATPase subunit b